MSCKWILWNNVGYHTKDIIKLVSRQLYCKKQFTVETNYEEVNVLLYVQMKTLNVFCGNFNLVSLIQLGCNIMLSRMQTDIMKTKYDRPVRT